MKKISLLLAIMITISSFIFSANANMVTSEFTSTPPLEIEKDMAPVRGEIRGVITEVEEHPTTPYSLFAMKTESGKEIVVRVTDATQIISKGSGKSMSFSDNFFMRDTKVTVAYTTYYDTQNEKMEDLMYPKDDIYIPRIVIANVIVRDDVETDENTLVQDTHIYRISSTELTDDSVKIITDNRHKYSVSADKITTTWFPYKKIDLDTLSKGSYIMVAYNFNENMDGYKNIDYVRVIDYAAQDEQVHIRHNANENCYDIYCHANANKNDGWVNIGKVEEIECEKYIPLRKVIEALGPNFAVGWDGSKVFVCKNNVTYKFNNTWKTANVSNGRPVRSNSTPDLCVIIRNGVTYVPYTWIADIFNVACLTPVKW